jgi:CRISPR-associated exonuclease Cas4
VNDEPPLPISALQHWAYCPRQCGLIHLEQAFDDNLHTLRGQAVHAQVDQPGFELRRGLRVERALPLFHDALGLVGKADTVEFEPDGTPYPVEYKHGSRHKATDIAACDDLQLAAQAMCLEAMTGRAVPEAALFYAGSKRRRVMTVDAALRERVARAAAEVRAMLRAERLPPPTADRRRCGGCSLRERCQPEALDRLLAEGADDLFDPVDDPGSAQPG